MRSPFALALAAAVAPAACGGSPPAELFFSLSLAQTADRCAEREALREGLRIWLFVDSAEERGVAGRCAFLLETDDHIQGSCFLPGLRDATLTLFYGFALEPSVEGSEVLSLASYRLDAVSFGDGQRVALDFSTAQASRAFDNDADGVDNLTEVCAGHRPDAATPSPSPTAPPSPSPTAPSGATPPASPSQN